MDQPGYNRLLCALISHKTSWLCRYRVSCSGDSWFDQILDFRQTINTVFFSSFRWLQAATNL